MYIEVIGSRKWNFCCVNRFLLLTSVHAQGRKILSFGKESKISKVRWFFFKLYIDCILHSKIKA